MDWKLYNKYGVENKDGYYIKNHQVWHYYAQRPRLYIRNKIFAWLCLLIPICGIIGTYLIFDEMGLSIF